MHKAYIRPVGMDCVVFPRRPLELVYSDRGGWERRRRMHQSVY